MRDCTATFHVILVVRKGLPWDEPAFEMEGGPAGSSYEKTLWNALLCGVIHGWWGSKCFVEVDVGEEKCSFEESL